VSEATPTPPDSEAETAADLAPEPAPERARPPRRAPQLSVAMDAPPADGDLPR
jgi:hypothetical protein